MDANARGEDLSLRVCSGTLCFNDPAESPPPIDPIRTAVFQGGVCSGSFFSRRYSTSPFFTYPRFLRIRYSVSLRSTLLSCASSPLRTDLPLFHQVRPALTIHSPLQLSLCTVMQVLTFHAQASPEVMPSLCRMPRNPTYTPTALVPKFTSRPRF